MSNNLEKLAKLIRYYILVSTTEAGSGHPTSSLSATDLMAVLMFGPSRLGDTSGRAEICVKISIVKFNLGRSSLYK